MGYDSVMLDILKEIFSMGEDSKNRWYCFTMDIKENLSFVKVHVDIN